MERKVYTRPQSLTDLPFMYCPGCGHSTVHKIIAELVDELELREKTIAVAPVGCAVYAYDFWDFDVSEAPHGRAPVVATAIKRIRPDSFVFSYQGDGDLASIGMAETIHTANRGENITVVFINNANYGMTGGQMAPTSLIGQVTTTSPMGRDAENYGHPIRIAELLCQLEGVKYVERVKVTNASSIIRTRKALRKAFLNQINGTGFSFVEILASCPTNWFKTPVQSNKWIDTELESYFKLGLLKDVK